MPVATTRAARKQPTSGRSRVMLALIVGPLVCSIALTALAYIGLTQQEQRAASAQVAVAAQAARGAIQLNMGDLTVSNGQLTSALPANVTTLNGATTEANRLRTLTGADVVIAQRQADGFVVIASSLSASTNGAMLGGSLASQTCAHTNSPAVGTVTIAGATYVAGAAPLLDGSGDCVGAALSVISASSLQHTTLEYTVLLAMVGALFTLITVAVGLMLQGRSAPATDSAHDDALRAAVATLAEAHFASAAQLQQREWVGRRLAAGRRQMRRLMTSLAVDRVALQDATADIWAGVSHPGAPVDPSTAMRLVREGAVVAARIGSRLNDVDAVTADLFGALDTAEQVDAMLDEALARSGVALDELGALTGAGPTQPSDASDQRDQPLDPYATAVLESQAGSTGETPRVAPQQPSDQSGAHRAVRPESSQHRSLLTDSAKRRAMGASGGPRQQWQSGASGQHRARQQPRQQQPRNSFGPSPDGRDRGASGSRWLND